VNWKEFLKPDKKKIILMIIFLLATFFFSNVCMGPGGIAYNLILAPFYIYNKGTGIYSLCTWNFIPLLLSFIYWYLLSCLIVWIYKKIKK